MTQVLARSVVFDWIDSMMNFLRLLYGIYVISSVVGIVVGIVLLVSLVVVLILFIRRFIQTQIPTNIDMEGLFSKIGYQKNFINARTIFIDSKDRYYSYSFGNNGTTCIYRAENYLAATQNQYSILLQYPKTKQAALLKILENDIGWHFLN